MGYSLIFIYITNNRYHNNSSILYSFFSILNINLNQDIIKSINLLFWISNTGLDRLVSMINGL